MNSAEPTLPAVRPFPRPSARVLLVDDADRLLLFSTGSKPDGSQRWFAVGGGVEAGESHEQAARREVFEETGLTDVSLSAEVWRGQPWIAHWDGIAYEVRQRYFLARVASFEIDTSRFEKFEKSKITGHRWWTVEELRATTDQLRPAGLPALLESLLSKGPPAEPSTVDG